MIQAWSHSLHKARASLPCTSEPYLVFLLHIQRMDAGACGAFKAKNENHNPTLEIPDDAFTENSFVRVFGKPETHVGRRMAVSLVLDNDVEKAKERALEIAASISDS